MELTTEELREFDRICAKTFHLMLVEKHGGDSIDLIDFDPTDPNHLFVLYVAKGLAGVLRQPVRVKTGWLALRKLNRGLEKECCFKRLRGRTGISVDRMLSQLWEEDGRKTSPTIYGRIYEAYYKPERG